MQRRNVYVDYNDNKEHTILIVDDSRTIRKFLQTILAKNNYHILSASNGVEAWDILQNKGESVDLVVTDINMPEMGGFELISKIKKQGLNLSYIMITNADIDTFLNLALEHDIGNILGKPLVEDEVLTLVCKLITGKGIFGLENYLYGEKRVFKKEIASSLEAKNSVKEIAEFFRRCGIAPEMVQAIHLLLFEVLINAIYHAHGFTDAKERGEHIVLEQGQKVEIKYGADDLKFGVAVTDFNGKLTKHGILQRFKDYIDNDKKARTLHAEGKDISPYLADSGRGLIITMQMSPEYYINIKKDEVTEVILLGHINETAVSGHPTMALKINEII